VEVFLISIREYHVNRGSLNHDLAVLCSSGYRKRGGQKLSLQYPVIQTVLSSGFLKGDCMPESQAFTGQTKIKMYATTWCGDCRMSKHWFDTHGIPYEYINIERDERAAAEVLRLNGGMCSVPTIVFPDGSILVEPSARQLAAKCLQEPEPSLGERLKNLYEGILKRES